MKTHDLIGTTNKFTTNEHGWNGRAATKPQESLFDFTPSGDLIELMDSWARPKVIEKGPDGVAHAARTLTEDHHRPLGCQLCHPLHC